ILELSGIGDPEVLLKAGIDVQLSLPGVGTNVQEHLYTGVTYRKYSRLSPSILDPTKRHMSLVLALNNPFSRGSIHIRSNDFRMQPVIDPRIFEQPYDLITMVELVKFARRIAHTEPLAGLLSGTEVYPGPQVETDEQIAEWLKDTISTTYHTVGSCSMLPLEDDGVVDAKLKVYGTTNIRVVDIGIIPLHVGGHTQGTLGALRSILRSRMSCIPCWMQLWHIV
ncbi:hypothetical protein CERSUDRAFT_52107, partial [Gelatoporia subvermispora B]